MLENTDPKKTQKLLSTPQSPALKPAVFQKGINGSITRKKIVEISSLQDLSFANFIYTDMSLFSAKVTGVHKKVMLYSVRLPIYSQTKHN